MKNTFLVLALMTLFAISGHAQQNADFNVVPLPQSCVQEDKTMPLSNITRICCDDNEDMKRIAGFLAEYLKPYFKGQALPLVVEKKTKKPADAVQLRLNKKLVGDEEYCLTVGKKGILIEGKTPRGVFYGIQTLRKALPVGAEEVAVPFVRIADCPRFSYRGMHLDVGRHFFDVDFVKQYIDMMVLHNMNTFHWHLTEDQGWRMQVDKYPLLTEVGAWRNRTVIGRNTGLYEYNRYGGFYTKEQMREIVKYAADRYITVIPEIDMPGHMEAALAAYPNLGCTGGPYEVEPNWGVFDEILCAGKEETFTFLEGVLDELMEIFPSEYIHIGGDESPRTRWKSCPLCQKRIKEEGLKQNGKRTPEDLLQGYFTRRIEKYIHQHGRKIIGWDELLECNVEPSATIMSWRGPEGGLAASELGHDVIMSPTSSFYFDYYQTKESEWSHPLLIGGYLPLDKTYNTEPAPDTLSPEAKKHIIGVQANLWTEYIGAPELAEYQVLPRMAALAEVQWMQPEAKDFEAFKVRAKRLMKCYDALGWKYCTEAWRTDAH